MASATTAVAANDIVTVAADCPSGTTVVGGGFAVVKSDGSDVTTWNDLGPQLHGSRPKASGNGWESVIVNGASSTKHVKVYARCV